MPRPHQTLTNRSTAVTSGNFDTELPSVSGSLSKLQQENARLKTELHKMRQSDAPASMHSRSVMWMACGLCGVALLFALAALFRH